MTYPPGALPVHDLVHGGERDATPFTGTRASLDLQTCSGCGADLGDVPAELGRRMFLQEQRGPAETFLRASGVCKTCCRRQLLGSVSLINAFTYYWEAASRVDSLRDAPQDMPIGQTGCVHSHLSRESQAVQASGAPLCTLARQCVVGLDMSTLSRQVSAPIKLEHVPEGWSVQVRIRSVKAACEWKAKEIPSPGRNSVTTAVPVWAKVAVRICDGEHELAQRETLALAHWQPHPSTDYDVFRVNGAEWAPVLNMDTSPFEVLCYKRKGELKTVFRGVSLQPDGEWQSRDAGALRKLQLATRAAADQNGCVCHADCFVVLPRAVLQEAVDGGRAPGVGGGVKAQQDAMVRERDARWEDVAVRPLLRGLFDVYDGPDDWQKQVIERTLCAARRTATVWDAQTMHDTLRENLEAMLRYHCKQPDKELSGRQRSDWTLMGPLRLPNGLLKEPELQEGGGTQDPIAALRAVLRRRREAEQQKEAEQALDCLVGVLDGLRERCLRLVGILVPEAELGGNCPRVRARAAGDLLVEMLARALLVWHGFRPADSEAECRAPSSIAHIMTSLVHKGLLSAVKACADTLASTDYGKLALSIVRPVVLTANTVAEELESEAWRKTYVCAGEPSARISMKSSAEPSALWEGRCVKRLRRSEEEPAATVDALAEKALVHAVALLQRPPGHWKFSSYAHVCDLITKGEQEPRKVIFRRVDHRAMTLQVNGGVSSHGGSEELRRVTIRGERVIDWMGMTDQNPGDRLHLTTAAVLSDGADGGQVLALIHEVLGEVLGEAEASEGPVVRLNGHVLRDLRLGSRLIAVAACRLLEDKLRSLSGVTVEFNAADATVDVRSTPGRLLHRVQTRPARVGEGDGEGEAGMLRSGRLALIEAAEQRTQIILSSGTDLTQVPPGAVMEVDDDHTRGGLLGPMNRSSLHNHSLRTHMCERMRRKAATFGRTGDPYPGEATGATFMHEGAVAENPAGVGMPCQGDVLCSVIVSITALMYDTAECAEDALAAVLASFSDHFSWKESFYTRKVVDGEKAYADKITAGLTPALASTPGFDNLGADGTARGKYVRKGDVICFVRRAGRRVPCVAWLAERSGWVHKLTCAPGTKKRCYLHMTIRTYYNLKTGEKLGCESQKMTLSEMLEVLMGRPDVHVSMTPLTLVNRASQGLLTQSDIIAAAAGHGVNNVHSHFRTPGTEDLFRILDATNFEPEALLRVLVDAPGISHLGTAPYYDRYTGERRGQLAYTHLRVVVAVNKHPLGNLTGRSGPGQRDGRASSIEPQLQHIWAAMGGVHSHHRSLQMRHGHASAEHSDEGWCARCGCVHGACSCAGRHVAFTACESCVECGALQRACLCQSAMRRIADTPVGHVQRIAEQLRTLQLAVHVGARDEPPTYLRPGQGYQWKGHAAEVLGDEGEDVLCRVQGGEKRLPRSELRWAPLHCPGDAVRIDTGKVVEVVCALDGAVLVRGSDGERQVKEAEPVLPPSRRASGEFRSWDELLKEERHAVPENGEALLRELSQTVLSSARLGHELLRLSCRACGERRSEQLQCVSCKETRAPPCGCVARNFSHNEIPCGRWGVRVGALGPKRRPPGPGCAYCGGCGIPWPPACGCGALLRTRRVCLAGCPADAGRSALSVGLLRDWLDEVKSFAKGVAELLDSAERGEWQVLPSGHGITSGRLQLLRGGDGLLFLRSPPLRSKWKGHSRPVLKFLSRRCSDACRGARLKFDVLDETVPAQRGTATAPLLWRDLASERPQEGQHWRNGEALLTAQQEMLSAVDLRERLRALPLDPWVADWLGGQEEKSVRVALLLCARRTAQHKGRDPRVLGTDVYLEVEGGKLRQASSSRQMLALNPFQLSSCTPPPPPLFGGQEPRPFYIWGTARLAPCWRRGDASVECTDAHLLPKDEARRRLCKLPAKVCPDFLTCGDAERTAALVEAFCSGCGACADVGLPDVEDVPSPAVDPGASLLRLEAVLRGGMHALASLRRAAADTLEELTLLLRAEGEDSDSLGEMSSEMKDSEAGSEDWLMDGPSEASSEMMDDRHPASPGGSEDEQSDLRCSGSDSDK